MYSILGTYWDTGKENGSYSNAKKLQSKKGCLDLHFVRVMLFLCSRLRFRV